MLGATVYRSQPSRRRRRARPYASAADSDGTTADGEGTGKHEHDVTTGRFNMTERPGLWSRNTSSYNNNTTKSYVVSELHTNALLFSLQSLLLI